MKQVESVEDIIEAAALEELDFTLRCEHGAHNDPMHQHHHGGPATHWLLALHHCGEQQTRIAYMGCAAWVEYVRSKAYDIWVCPRCRFHDDGRFMVIVAGPIR